MTDIIERAEAAYAAHHQLQSFTYVPELIAQLKAARAENKRLADALIRIQTTR